MSKTTPQAASSTPAPADTFTADYPSLFGDTSTDCCAPEALESQLGPMAYAHALYGWARQFERDYDTVPYSPLDRRRPDIGNLLLNEAASSKRVSRLSLVIGILEATVGQVARSDDRDPGVEDGQRTPAEVIASARSPASLPFDRWWNLAHQVLKYKHVSYWTALRQIDQDFPGFANGATVSSSMRDTLVLCGRVSPAQAKLLAAPITAGRDDALRKIYGLAGDTALEELSDTSIFLDVTGLNRKRLRQLLAVHGVAAPADSETFTSVTVSRAGQPEGAVDSATFGASYINSGGSPALRLVRGATAGVKNTRIVGMGADHLDRIWRLLGLAAAMKLGFAPLDRLLQASFAAQGRTTDARIDSHVLRALGLYRHLNDLHQVDVDSYAATLHHISPYATGRETPYYDRLFQRGTGKASVIMDGQPFKATRTDATVGPLGEGLGLSSGTLVQFLEWVTVALDLEAPRRDLAVVSACHRLAMVPRWLGLHEQQALALLRLFRETQPDLFKKLAGKPSLASETTSTAADTVVAIAVLMNMAAWLGQHGFDPAQVLAVVVDDGPSSADREAAVQAVKAATRENGDATLIADLARLFGELHFAEGTTVDEKAPSVVLRSLLTADGILIDDMPGSDDTRVYSEKVAAALTPLVDPGDEAAQTTGRAAALQDVVQRAAHRLSEARVRQSTQAADVLAALLPGVADAAVRDAVCALAGVTRRSLLALCHAKTAASTDAVATALTALRRPAALAMLLNPSAAELETLRAEPDLFGLEKNPAAPALRKIDLVLIHRLAEWNLVIRQAARNAKKSPAETATALLSWLKARVRTEDAVKELASILGLDPSQVGALGKTPPNAPALAWLLRLHAVADTAALSADALRAFSGLSVESDAATIQNVVEQLLAKCSERDREGIRHWHHVDWRKAMVDWLLRHARDVDKRPFAHSDALSDWLLTDLDVGPEPETTRLSAAIDGMQLYINRLLTGLERRLDDPDQLKERRKAWSAWQARYSDWRARQERELYPENFIDPAHRHYKTQAFADLEMQLAQGQARPADIETNLLAYLATFERLSNIQVLSAYQDGIKPIVDNLHLIGRSNAQPVEYFWRTADLSRKTPDGQTSMLAWSDWERVDLPVVGELVRTTLPTAGSAEVEKKAAELAEARKKRETCEATLKNQRPRKANRPRPSKKIARPTPTWNRHPIIPKSDRTPPRHWKMRKNAS